MNYRQEIVTYHFESKESIDASLVMLPASEEEAEPPFPSFVFAVPSPTCDGFHEESWASGPLDWDWERVFQQRNKNTVKILT